MTTISKYNSKSKFIIQMETTYNDEFFEPGVTKTKDGRTRRQRDFDGNLASVEDTPSGTELKNEPGTGLKS